MKTLGERVGAGKRPYLASIAGSIWPVVAGVVIALVLQAAIAPALGDYKARILLDIGIAIVLSVSLNIVNGFAGQFSIGHAGFMVVGGYAACVLTYYGSIKLWGSADVHGGFLGAGDLLLLGACVVAGIVAAVAGLLVGLPSLRLRGDYLAIVTLGFGEIVRVLVTISKDVLYPSEVGDQSFLTLASHLGSSAGFVPKPPSYLSPTPWKEATGHAGIFFVYVFVALVCIVAYRLKSSSKGRALLAVRENEVAAEAMGIDTARVKVSAFVLAAFFAGIGGALFAHEFGVTFRPGDLGFQKSIDLVIIVVLGGMGSITGVVFAATILTILPEVFREFAQYRMVVFALALIVVMIVRPQGLMGIRELWELGPWKKTIGRGWNKLMAPLRKLGGTTPIDPATIKAPPAPPAVEAVAAP
jgi:branched-chain amino acid transport system permease protein